MLTINQVLSAVQWREYYENRRMESKMRNDWEIARLLAAYSISPYMKRKINNLKDLFAFDWDTQEIKQLTEEEKATQREIFSKWDAEMRSNVS